MYLIIRYLSVFQGRLITEADHLTEKEQLNLNPKPDPHMPRRFGFSSSTSTDAWSRQATLHAFRFRDRQRYGRTRPIRSRSTNREHRQESSTNPRAVPASRAYDQPGGPGSSRKPRIASAGTTSSTQRQCEAHKTENCSKSGRLGHRNQGRSEDVHDICTIGTAYRGKSNWT